ncbi:hypothetical protein GCM10009531_74810 [Actinoplanes capillaceus]
MRTSPPPPNPPRPARPARAPAGSGPCRARRAQIAGPADSQGCLERIETALTACRKDPANSQGCFGVGEKASPTLLADRPTPIRCSSFRPWWALTVRLPCV